MASRKKSAKKGAPARSVTLKLEQFRSMILDKLRLDIDAKRAAYEQAARLSSKDLGMMSYYKMRYWKMHYWKKGIQSLPGEEVINPVILRTQVRRAKKQVK